MTPLCIDFVQVQELRTGIIWIIIPGSQSVLSGLFLVLVKKVGFVNMGWTFKVLFINNLVA